MKATEQRDIYADALRAYRQEVPVDQWPVYRAQVSRSGLARIFRAQGFERFERKRFESAKCAPIIEEMDEIVREFVTERGNETRSRLTNLEDVDSKEVARLRRQVDQLERDLRNAQRREESYRKRCGLLEAELQFVRRQHDAFEEHCRTSLTTLHV